MFSKRKEDNGTLDIESQEIHKICHLRSIVYKEQDILNEVRKEILVGWLKQRNASRLL